MALPDQARERRILLGLAHEWELACSQLAPAYRARMQKPSFRLADTTRLLGQWSPARREISLSRQLAENHPWDEIREVLRHETAHQLADAMPGRAIALDRIRARALAELGRLDEALAAAGLNRVTVSLDSMDDTVFMAMNDVGYPVDEVLAGIDAAAAAGLTPVKVNMVVKRGVNEDSIVEVAEHIRGTGHIVRFIEYMDVGNRNGWRMDQVVPSRELLERVRAAWPVRPVGQNYPGEVARRYEYVDGQGEIGFISSVTEPFCRDCTRARLSSDGKLFTCLFASRGLDLRTALRAGASDDELLSLICESWRNRGDRYSEQRAHLPQRKPHI